MVAMVSCQKQGLFHFRPFMEKQQGRHLQDCFLYGTATGIFSCKKQGCHRSEKTGTSWGDREAENGYSIQQVRVQGPVTKGSTGIS